MLAAHLHRSLAARRLICPQWPGEFGFIDLDEGFRPLAEIDAPPGAVRVGQRVTAGWEDHAELAAPVFRPAQSG